MAALRQRYGIQYEAAAGNVLQDKQAHEREKQQTDGGRYDFVAVKKHGGIPFCL